MLIQNVRAHVVAAFASSIVASSAFAGPEWIESGDAGSILSFAQKTFGADQIASIAGTLSFDNGIAGANDLEDMYLIQVINPGLFSLSVEADFDAQLFVFNVTKPGEAFGLLANDNTISGANPFLTSASNDGTLAAINLPGVYAIAISAAGRNPVSVGGSIFNYGSPTEISGPDGPGGINPHTGWTGEGAGGNYKITLTGSDFYDLPAPGAAALLGLAALVGRSRRRLV